MKNLHLLLFTIVLAFSIPTNSLNAQSSDKEMRELLKSLKYEKEINVIIDFSKAKIHGKSESDFVYIEDISSTEDWTTLWETEYKPGLCHDLLGEFNTNMFDYGYKIRFGSFENAHYQILLRVNSISEKGNTIMNAYIVERGQKNVLCNLFISGTGGTFGSKVNLMGDGFKRAGKELARQMNILFKRGRI